MTDLLGFANTDADWQHHPPMVFDWTSIDTVLLDMDGTLLDLRFDNYFWQEHLPLRYAERHGMTAQQAAQELWPRFAAKQGTLEWYCTDYWSRELGLDIPELKHEARELIRYLPGAQAFLAAVRDLDKKLVLLTNAHHDSLRVKCAYTQLHRHFDELISSHSIGSPKEHAQFWTSLEQHDWHCAQRSIFIDDSLSVLRAARAYGIAHVYGIAQPDSTLPARELSEFPMLRSLHQLLPDAERAKSR